MATLSFKQLAFKDQGDRVLVFFLKKYHTAIPREDLLAIGLAKVEKNALHFTAGEKSAQTKFAKVLARSFESLISPNGRPVTYLHANLGIPLIGTNDFGIIDRDTDVVEVKPMTGCNLNCTFCSVDEGPQSKKVRDFLVEKDYLISAFIALAERKQHPVEAHIAGQNEPTLYPELACLIHDLSSHPCVRETAIDTNGTLLSAAFLKELEKAGLSRIDLSLHALDPVLAARLAGASYDLGHVLSIARLIAKSKMRLLIAPVLLPGVNEGEIEKIILFAKGLDCLVGIQNFYAYDRGRRPVKELPMAAFEALLAKWERTYDVDLHLKGVFSTKKDNVLEKPFLKGDRVRAEVFSPGKYPGEVLAHAKGRIITLHVKEPYPKKGDVVTVRIVRDKHNIFNATL